jgi:hypothetical protein
MEGRPDTEPLIVQKGSPTMPANNAKTEPGGFSAQERAAMKKTDIGARNGYGRLRAHCGHRFWN